MSNVVFRLTRCMKKVLETSPENSESDCDDVDELCDYDLPDYNHDDDDDDDDDDDAFCNSESSRLVVGRKRRLESSLARDSVNKENSPTSSSFQTNNRPPEMSMVSRLRELVSNISLEGYEKQLRINFTETLAIRVLESNAFFMNEVWVILILCIYIFNCLF